MFEKKRSRFEYSAAESRIVNLTTCSLLFLVQVLLLSLILAVGIVLFVVSPSFSCCSCNLRDEVIVKARLPYIP